MLSVVVPVYGCADCLEPLHRRLKAVLDRVAPRHEIVLVDDRSPDGAWSRIEAIAARDPAVVALRLSRTFGQHAAITAGLAECRGAAVVVMDCDLQDPPEEIPRLIERAAQGFDIVFARRVGRKHSVPRRLAARVFRGLLRALTGARADASHGTFSLIARPVVDAFLTLGDRDRHYLLILHWLGFRTGAIDYVHAEREAGRSAYTPGRLVRHALDGLFFQTTALLRWIVYLGFAVSLAGLGLAVRFVYLYFSHDVPPGWTSLAVLILVIGGFIIASTGIAGLYVGRIFEQVKGRPLYVVDRRIARPGPDGG